MVKRALIEYKKRGKYDNYPTPPYAVKSLLKYIPKEWTIWECTGVNSPITKVFRDAGYKVIETCIDHPINRMDFLTDKPDFEFDCIITNPPYSLKTEFLKKCYEYGKPFALLLPLTALEGVERNKLYRKYGIQLLVFDRRVEFDENGRGVWFPVAWFCWKILPKDLIFEELDHK